MKNIAEKVKLAKLGDESAMMELIEMWSPLINKFVRLLKYDEDCRSEMIVKLILLVKKEIDLNNINNLNDCTIIQYIRTSLTHYYIALSTGRAKIRNSEISYDEETLINLRERDFSDNMVFTDRLLLDYLRTVLSEREYLCIS